MTEPSSAQRGTFDRELRALGVSQPAACDAAQSLSAEVVGCRKNVGEEVKRVPPAKLLSHSTTALLQVSDSMPFAGRPRKHAAVSHHRGCS